MSDFSYDELEFEHVEELAIEYESFFMDDEPQYDMFDFDTCSVDFIAEIASTCDTSAVSLDLKPLLKSRKYAFLGPNELLPVIIFLIWTKTKRKNCYTYLG